MAAEIHLAAPWPGPSPNIGNSPTPWDAPSLFIMQVSCHDFGLKTIPVWVNTMWIFEDSFHLCFTEKGPFFGVHPVVHLSANWGILTRSASEETLDVTRASRSRSVTELRDIVQLGRNATILACASGWYDA